WDLIYNSNYTSYLLSLSSTSSYSTSDTLASLKKTCHKMDISFWDFFQDRLTSGNQIKYLPDLTVDWNQSIA
ncbi:MAG: hypothetical protein KAK04_19510, partial [Cyclobacteriaceae bacterium]|nr:hypothetical protein [Cyclobacteriaceae bacterium]